MGDGEINVQNDVRGAPIFAEHLPLRVIERQDGLMLLEAEFTSQHLNAAGTVHGGVLATVFDIAATGAAKGIRAETFGVTMSLTINFMRQASAGRAWCEGVVVGGGARTRFVEARLRDAGGAIIAAAMATVRVIEL